MSRQVPSTPPSPYAETLKARKRNEITRILVSVVLRNETKPYSRQTSQAQWSEEATVSGSTGNSAEKEGVEMDTSSMKTMR